MKDDKVYLYHILEAINRIQGYVKDLPYEEFLDNSEKKDAVVRNLEIIGEAANKISPKIKNKSKNIVWRDIIDMRNRLIHHYFEIDYEIVWDVVINELASLKEHIEVFLK